MEKSRKDWRRGAERVVLTGQAPLRLTRGRMVLHTTGVCPQPTPAPDGSSSQTDGSSDGAEWMVVVRVRGDKEQGHGQRWRGLGAGGEGWR